jgi:hypothetical protein
VNESPVVVCREIENALLFNEFSRNKKRNASVLKNITLCPQGLDDVVTALPRKIIYVNSLSLKTGR